MNPLAKIRERMGWQQKQMAYALGVSTRTVQEQEATPRPRVVYVLAAERLEARHTASNQETLDNVRCVMRQIAELAEKGAKL